MKKTRIKNNIFAVAILATALLFSGCINVDSKFARLSEGILEKGDFDYNTDVEFALGPGSISLIKFFLAASDKDQEILEALDPIYKIQVGVYKLRDGASENLDFQYCRELASNLRKDAWENFVLTKDEDEIAAIFVQKEDGEYTGLLTVALQKKELAVVEVRGNIEKLFELAVKDRSLNIARN